MRTLQWVNNFEACIKGLVIATRAVNQVYLASAQKEKLGSKLLSRHTFQLSDVRTGLRPSAATKYRGEVLKYDWLSPACSNRGDFGVSSMTHMPRTRGLDAGCKAGLQCT